MFNFDLKKSDIYLAIKWKPVFAVIKIIKNICLILCGLFFVLFAAAFLYGFFTKSITIGSGRALLGLFLIFAVCYIATWLKTRFFESKIKNPIPKANLKNLISSPEKYNLADFLSFEVADAVNKSISLAKDKGLTSSHLFYCLLKDNLEFNFIFSRLLVGSEALKKSISEYIKNLAPLTENNFLADNFKNTILGSLEEADKKGNLKIEAGDVITALAKFDPVMKKTLNDFSLKEEDVENLIWWFENAKKREQKGKRFWEYENLARKGTLAKAWSAGYTINLNKYAIDWTERIRRNPVEIVGHKKELEMMERIMAGSGVNNVLLIGDPGTGKEQMILAFAQKSMLGLSLLEDNYKRVVELDMVSFLAGIENIEEVEEMLDIIFRETVSAGNIVLVINNFDNYVGQDLKPGVVDISGIISQYLSLPQCQIVAITTYDGLHQNIEKNSSILSLFEKVEVSELSKRETLMILEDMALSVERKYGFIVSYPALREIVDLSERYISNSAFPQKAIKVFDDVAVYVSSAVKEKVVLPKHVFKIITEKTEVPVGEIEAKEKEILLNLENLIHNRIINQNEAVKEISSAMRRARSEITIRKGPIGAFIFLGPTGVGKTETSKALAEVYFGSESKIIRLDMSEFQDVKDIPRLIGSKEQPGLLTTPIRENPFSVLLLDEIEKADSNIRNLFLQVLDEGYLSDGMGKKVDFKNTIIIATSNAGYQMILEAEKESIWSKNIKERLIHHLFNEGIFQPEFINRFDSVIVFSPLSRQNLLDIASLMLKHLVKNLKEKGIEFEITESLKQKIADLGYNPVFGAREMRRVVQEKVENVLAPAVLSGKLKRGDKASINPQDFSLIIGKSTF